MLSPEGLTMAPYKVQIIQDWPEPRKVKDIQSFLGFTNFYCHFIFGYSEITIPLTCLTRKGTLGTSLMSAAQPLKHLKRLSPQLWSLPIGLRTLKLQSRLTPLTMPFNYDIKWQTAPYCIPLPDLFHSRTQLQHP